MKRFKVLTASFIMILMMLVPFTAYAAEAISPEYYEEDPPPTPPTPPGPPIVPTVLGATRELPVLEQAVLGATRSPQTGEANLLVIWFVAAGAGVVAVWSGRKLVEE